MLVGVALVCVLEDSVGLGAILPAETVVVPAAAAAANGVVPVWSVFLVAWVFGVAGDSAGLAIGRRWGDRLIERYGPRVGLTPERVSQADAFVERRGAWRVAGGRLIPAVRTLAMPVAGASTLPCRRFLPADVEGVAAWATLPVAVGYAVGVGIERADDTDLLLVPSALGVYPEEALPGVFRWIASWHPLRYLTDTLRSIAFFDGSGAGLGRGVTVR